MKTHTWAFVRVTFIILILLPGGLLYGARAASTAEHQAYLPLVTRDTFVPSRGLLDSEFGWSGMVDDSFTADRGYGRAAALQPDGKLVLVGSLEVEVDRYAMTLARYHPDGSLDTSFGDGDGIVITALDPGSAQIYDLALQAGGEILVAGSLAYQNGSDFLVARFTPDGSLDASFDEDGWLLTDFGEGDSGAYSLTLQPDGKIVAAGTATEQLFLYYDDFALARYNPDGSPDNSFDGDGKAQVDFNGYYERGRVIALQPDGKILVAGTLRVPAMQWSVYNFVLARFNGDGSLDTGFGDQGWVNSSFADSGGPEGCEDLLLQPDGKIVVAGWANIDETGFTALALARFNPDGSPDTGFGTNGNTVTQISNDFYYGSSVALQPDGTLLLAGTVLYINHFFSESAFVLARYTADGILDTSFSYDGWLTLTFAMAGNQCEELLLQPDGKILLAGSVAGDLALARLYPDGSLDTTFDLDGMVTTDLTVDSEGVRAVAVQPDGKLVVGGYGWDGVSGDQFIVARYTPTGTLDTSFDGDGWLATNLSPGRDQINDLVLQKDGKILVAGDTQDPDDESYDFALARYHPDGSLDTSFDGDGWLTTDFYGADEHANSLLVQPDGKIVVVGSAEVPGNDDDIALARYHPDGSLDTSFGEAGKVVTDSGIQKEDFGFAVALQRDGKILASAGISLYTGTDFVHRFSVARYLPDGSLDASFDGDGLVITEFYDLYEVPMDLLVQPNGKILAGGWTNSPNGTTDFALARYLPDGSLDESFGHAGKLTTDFVGRDNLAWALALQPDGMILMAGYSDLYSAGESVFLLARYTAEGSLDIEFSQDGWLDTDFVFTYDDECYAMLLQPDGYIVLAGVSGGDFALVRYR